MNCLPRGKLAPIIQNHVKVVNCFLTVEIILQSLKGAGLKKKGGFLNTLPDCFKTRADDLKSRVDCFKTRAGFKKTRWDCFKRMGGFLKRRVGD
jgi:hypothetical protein